MSESEISSVSLLYGPDTLFTTFEVAAFLQADPSSVAKWVSAGHLRAFKTPGGHRRVAASDLVQFMHKQGMPVPATLRVAGRKRLLIVDDDVRLTRSLGRLLKPWAFAVDAEFADNGIDALVKVGSFKPHLVVLDVVMPGLDGIEVCRRLKANRDTVNVAVIVMSAQFADETRQAALDVGATAAVEKPLSLDLLLETLEIRGAAPSMAASS